MANILVTGASGYLGGSFLTDIKNERLPPYGTIYALVRKEDQAKQVKEAYGAEPLFLDLNDQHAITTTLNEKAISIVFWMIDVVKFDAQIKLINGLASVSQKLGLQAHFLHVSGAKIFSVFAGLPTDQSFTDADDRVFQWQKEAKAPVEMLGEAAHTNTRIIEAGVANKVKTYIFMPCITYGRGTGFGNKISKQTKILIETSKAVGQVHKPDVDSTIGEWPVGHVYDNGTLYTHLLRKMLTNENIPHDHNGFYLASSGSPQWTDIYAAAAKALYKRGLVNTPEVGGYNEAAIEKAMKGTGLDKANIQNNIGGICKITAKNAYDIGWKPKYPAKHILEEFGDEIDLILEYTKG